MGRWVVVFVGSSGLLVMKEQLVGRKCEGKRGIFTGGGLDDACQESVTIEEEEGPDILP